MTTPLRRSPADDIALHSAWMRRLARAVAGDAAADDVVQDAWVKLDGRRERPGYLAAIVRSLARRRQRAERRRARREQQSAPAEALPSAADVAARSEIVRRLAEAVDRLEEPYRTTVVLRYYDDLPAAEIARRAGLPAATVRARLKRGLDRLRARLDEGGGRRRWLGVLLPWVRSDAGPTLAAGTALAALVAMKTALLSLAAACALVIAWLAFTDTQSQPALGTADVAGRGDVGPARASAPEPDQPAAPQRQPLAAVEQAAAGTPAAAAGAATVQARAVDPQRRPLSHAWLRLCGVPGAAATGDAQGRMHLELERSRLERLAGLDAERLVRFAVGAHGRQTRTLRAALPANRAALHLGDVVLEPGGAVHGRVVDAGGLGVEGAVVAFGQPLTAARDDDTTARRGPSDLHVEAWDGHGAAIVGRSGPGGEFHLAGVPTGFGTAWARARKGLWTHSEPVGVRAGEDVHGIELVVRDAPEETISGRVTDPDGRPVPHLGMTYRGENCNGSLHTDEQGAFHIAPVRLEPVRLEARSPREEWDDLQCDGVRPGTHGLALVFARTQWLCVAVQDDGGRPLQNGRVTGLPATGSTRVPLWRCESEVGGGGEARLRPPSGPLRLRVTSPGHRNVVLGPFDPRAWPEPLAVTLERVPALTGRVRTTEGRPAAGAVVSLHRAAGERTGRGGGSDGPPSWHLSHQAWGGDREAFVYALHVEPSARAIADEHGSFRLPLPGVDTRAANEEEGDERSLPMGAPRLPENLPRGARWYVHAALPGAATATTGPHEFESSRDVQLDLQLREGGTIEGTLVVAEGVSPAGWTMYASDGLAEIAAAPVAADGTFTFAHLHTGGWQVRAFEPRRHAPLRGGNVRTDRTPVPDVQVEAGRSLRYEHDARPRDAARLMGRVRIDGVPPGAATVRVATSTPQAVITHYERTLDPEGRFEIALQPGLSTSVAVVLPGAEPRLEIRGDPVVVPGANEWSVDVRTATLAGIFEDRGGRRLPWLDQLTYETQVGHVVARVSWNADADGRFGPIRVAAGPGVLRGPREDFSTPGPVLAEIDLRPGETRDLGRLPR